MADDRSENSDALPDLGSRVVPELEYELRFSLAGGPGGQNVNKVETKVQLRWPFGDSPLFTFAEKERIASSEEFKGRINKEGVVVLSCSVERTQSRNREAVIKLLHQLLAQALSHKKNRVPSRVPAKSKRKRLADKKQKSIKKALRSSPTGDD